MPCRRVAAGTLVLALLLPLPAAAALPEFIALMLYFYLFQQPQMMNHTQDVVDANLQSADAINRKRLEIWQKEVTMAMLPPPQSCVSLTLAKGLRVLDGLIPGIVNTQLQQGIAGITGNANPVQIVVARVRRHESRYCAEPDRARGRCSATSALPNGDLDAGLLLDTRGYTAAQDAAAQAFLDNLTAPAPLPALPAHLEKTPQADQLRGYLLTYGSRKAIARKVLANAYAERKRSGGIDTGTGPTAEKSAQELIFDDYERRFGDKEWVDQVLKAPPGALEREQLMIETWKMQMAMRQYRLQQDLNVTMAALLDVLTEQQGEEQITRLTEAAMRAKVGD
ncbi:MAG TPA: hypothetical protein PLM32_05840 [Candidatus Competibacter sp.]|jgi:hypothetical protein|nr:hypothetical protein [Candidatus Competibacter sp.]